MSERIWPLDETVTRRTLLAAAAGALGCTVAGCGTASEEKPTPANAPSAPSSAITPSPSRSPQRDPLDLKHLPNGPLQGLPWRYELNPAVPGYSNQAQIYDDQHATIHNGQLTIEAVRAQAGYLSSRIDTMGHWSFTHGRVTAVAKLPKGVGTWPAIWFLPDQKQTPAILAEHGIHDTPDSDYYYAWGGEIDMLETVGWQNNPVNNTMSVHSHQSIIAGNSAGISQLVQPVPTGENTFHEYSLTKRNGLIEFGLDGRTVHGVERQQGDTVADWPYDLYRYYLIANLALGGTWGGRMKQDFPPDGIDDSQAPWRFQIAELHYQPL